MSTGRQVLSAVALTALSAVFCAAQSLAPSHSGTVHYFDGDVSIDGVTLVSQVARFSDLKEQSTLKTALGRAEILLTPGVILRVAENSSIKMLDNRLMSTRVELISGTAMLESLESGTTVKDPPVTIVYKDFGAEPVKFGLFEISSSPAKLRVYKGEAKVFGNGTSVSVKDGNQIDLTMTMATSKFDVKDADDLYIWSRDRSAYISAANMSSSRQLADAGYGGRGSSGCANSYASSTWDPSQYCNFSGGWYYNAAMRMMVYIPFGANVYSPFGWGYYNPYTIAYYYVPGYYWTGAGGARTGTTTGVPLATAPTFSTTTRTNLAQLPRLGTTATMRPTLSAPARGTEIGSSTSSLGSRTGLSGIGPINNPGFNLGSSSANSPSPVASSPQPVMSAPAPAPVMSAPAAGSSAPVGGVRGR